MLVYHGYYRGLRTAMKNLFILGVLSIGLSTTGCAMMFNGNAEKNLNEWIKGTGLTAVGCVNVDSDGDGYVSCTARDSQLNETNVECRYQPLQKGCRKVDRIKGGGLIKP